MNEEKKEKLRNTISSVFNYDRLDVDQLDDVVNEIMVEFTIQKDIIKKETTKEILDIIEKQGTEICQGELPRAIYGLLIDFKKIKKQILKEFK